MPHEKGTKLMNKKLQQFYKTVAEKYLIYDFMHSNVEFTDMRLFVQFSAVCRLLTFNTHIFGGTYSNAVIQLVRFLHLNCNLVECRTHFHFIHSFIPCVLYSKCCTQNVSTETDEWSSFLSLVKWTVQANKFVCHIADVTSCFFRTYRLIHKHSINSKEYTFVYRWYRVPSSEWMTKKKPTEW